ncbi:MAG: hypothetical protein QOD99_1183 [Chthoniobacter sp.]|jgi:hypothetical protein|nr:hypothetical protein [Chthoniobacter sp.]
MNPQGFINQEFSPTELIEILSGKKKPFTELDATRNDSKKHLFYQRLQGPVIIGFFPDPNRCAEALLINYPSTGVHAPAITLNVIRDEFAARPQSLHVKALEEYSLFRIEGDTRFLRLLLHLTAETLDSKDWRLGPDKQKWAMALKLYRWLHEPNPHWPARTLELAQALKLQPLMANTLQKKVGRLLRKLV